MTGIDGYDWASVGWSNPVPGDPDVARQIGGQIQDISDDVSQQNFLLSTVGPDSAGFWSGPAATVFRPIAEKLPPELGKLITSYGDAASAINAYWPRHAAAQALAVQALSRAQTAHQALASAQQQVGSLQGQSSAAAHAYNQASTAAANPPAGSTPDPSAAANVSNLQTEYRSVQGQLGQAQGAVSSAQSSLGAAEAMRQQAVDNWNGAVSTLVSALHDAGNAGIHNVHHGLFGSLTHDVSSLFTSGVHGMEKFAKGQVSGIVHLGDDIAHVSEDAAGDIANGAAAAYHATAGWAKANMGVLKGIDSVLNDVSTGLGVLAIVCQPIPGLDAVVDVASDAVLVAKTADDGLELMGGDTAAESELMEDGVGLATAGTSKILDGMADDAKTAEKAAGATRDLEDGNQAVKETETVSVETSTVAKVGTDAKDGTDADAGVGTGSGNTSTGDPEPEGTGGATAGSDDGTSGDDGSDGRDKADGGDKATPGTSPASDTPASDTPASDTPAAGAPHAEPTPAGSDDGQMPSHGAEPTPASPEPATTASAPAAPTPAEAAPQPGAVAAHADGAARPGDTQPASGTPTAPKVEAPPGKVATALGAREIKQIQKSAATHSFTKAVDEEGNPSTYLKNAATKMQQTTHGRFAAARTVLQIREYRETIDKVDKSVHAWTGAHDTHGGAGAGQDDDKIDSRFVEDLVSGG